MPKKPKQSFAFADGQGGNVVISEDNVYADDDPLVKRWPDMFFDLADLVNVRTVEQATAAPGEVRRGPGRPRKDA